MEKHTAIIASNIMYLRRKNELTQLDLASKINYSDNAISRWERKEATPTIEALNIIATYFGVTIIDLLDENFQVRNEPADRRSVMQNILFILFSISVVWTLAVIGYIYISAFGASLGEFANHGWLIFVYSVPVSCVVFHYSYKQWRNRLSRLVSHSVFWWSLITSLYLSLLLIHHQNLWLIFILGLPIQLALLLSYFTHR